jgi:SAM-dependent methyltransferase
MNRLMERWVRSPAVYDLVQRLAGDARLRKRLAPHARALPAGATVVDIGGGTGLWYQPALAIRYICLDLDWLKLRRFKGRWPDGRAVVADATRCPLRSSTADAVVCMKVTHHLDDGGLDGVLREAARILRPGGVLLLADAVQSPRLVSQLLWRLDRGSHPRTADAIRRSLTSKFAVTDVEPFRIPLFHEFVLCVARREP